MPTQTVWIDPELLLKHRAVRVFHTYKDDDYNQGARLYEFTLSQVCGELDRLCDDQPCRHVFNVQELSTWQSPEQPPYCIGPDDTPENHAAWERYRALEQAAIQTAVKTAIEQGELTLRGWQPSTESKAAAVLGNSAQAGIPGQPMEDAIPEKSPDHD